MPTFGLFHKQKKQDQLEQTTENIPKDTPKQMDKAVTPEVQVEENLPKEPHMVQLVNQTIAVSASSETVVVESTGSNISIPYVECKTYLKAIPLRDLSDLEDIKTEIQNGNVLILRITPLASKSIESVKSAVNDLYAFTESIGGDIARLGEERVVICPKNIRIWREKMPVKTELLPTTVA